MASETVKDVELELVDSDGNIRNGDCAETIENMVESLKNVGLLYPVRLRRKGTRYRPIDGFCRVISAKRLGWKTIAAFVEGDQCSDVRAQVTALVANCLRNNLSDLDTAEAMEKLMQETGWNGSEAAAQLSFSTTKVSRLRELLKLPEPIRNAIRAGKIPVSCGTALGQIEDAEERATLAEQIAAGKLTRDGLTGVVKRKRSARAEKKAPGTARVTAALGNGRSVTLAGAGLDSLDTLIGWLEELLSKARKFRPKGVGVDTFVRILRDEAKATIGR